MSARPRPVSDCSPQTLDDLHTEEEEEEEEEGEEGEEGDTLNREREAVHAELLVG